MRFSYLERIPQNVKAVVTAVFFMDMSTLIAYQIYILFLCDSGLRGAEFDTIDSFIASMTLFIKFVFGIMSDYVNRRRLLVIIGYCCMMISKQLFCVATGFVDSTMMKLRVVLGAKLVERIGNGIQASPRDSFITANSPDGMRATCFSLKQSCGSIGSVLGTVAVILLLKYKRGQYTLIFSISLVPAIIATFVMLFYAREPKKKNNSDTDKNSKARSIGSRIPVYKTIVGLGGRFWIVMTVTFLVLVSNVSETTIINYFRRGIIGHVIESREYLNPILLTLVHIAAALFSAPIGSCIDKLRNKNIVFMIGSVICITCDCILLRYDTIITDLISGPVLVCYYTIAVAFLQSMVVDSVPPYLKGTALGIFYLCSAFAHFVRGCLVGFVSKRILQDDPACTFKLNIVLSIATIMAILLITELQNKLYLNNDDQKKHQEGVN